MNTGKIIINIAEYVVCASSISSVIALINIKIIRKSLILSVLILPILIESYIILQTLSEVSPDIYNFCITFAILIAPFSIFWAAIILFPYHLVGNNFRNS